MATNSLKRNQEIMQNKKDYDLQSAFHCKMPLGPYYWKNPEGLWGYIQLADANCLATYAPMHLCPFGGEYNPHMDNVFPFFESLEMRELQEKSNPVYFVDPPVATGPVEVIKLRVYFRTPELCYDRLESGEGMMYYVKPYDLRESMCNAKANRVAFLTHLQKMLGLPPVPVKPPINERPPKTDSMQSLAKAAATMDAKVRRSARRRNLPDWFCGPKTMPLKRKLFDEPKSGETEQTEQAKKKKKKKKKKRKRLKADYKISADEEKLKEAQFEVLQRERALIKLGKDWDAAFRNATEDVGIGATASVFFSLPVPYRSEMLKLICGGCTKQHLEYVAQKFYDVALKSVRDEYRATMNTPIVDLVSPDKEPKNNVVILYGDKQPKNSAGKPVPTPSISRGFLLRRVS